MADPADEPDFVASPFPWRCPDCRADIDAPDQVFDISSCALAPHSAYTLIEILCATCGHKTDAVVWVVDRGEFVKDAREGDGPSEIGEPSQLALLDRYLGLVEESRRQWEGFDGQLLDGVLSEMDHTPVDFDLSGERAVVALPARVLAAARGLRQAVNGRPDGQSLGLLRIRHFTCALSVDEMPSQPQPYALHLSVMNVFAPGELTPAECEFVLSLFFTPGERPFLRAQPGDVIPVTHFYLGSDFPDIGHC